LAGYLAQRKFSGLDDETVVYQGQNWKIVGTFSTGDWWDGYLIGDAPVVKKATKGSLDSLVRVRLSSPSAFTEFQHSVAGLLPAGVIVERESDYYADFWRDIPSTVFIVGYFLGGLVAAGAIAATIQTMHGALESRAREIAVLRAIGFDGKAVAVSALIEAMLLATTGALIGSALVWLWLDGFLYNGADAVFRVVVDLHLLLLACGWGLTVALIGAMPAAIKAALQTPLNALGSV
jgi:putative ABC transport system permease protein